MKGSILRRDKLSRFVERLIGDYEVIAPIDELSYGRIASASDMCLTSGKPMESLKEFFLPQREVLFQYRYEAGEVTLVDPPAPTCGPRVIFGARPCDAAALTILDKVFCWDFLDSSYIERRENTTIITLACDQPGATCFCVSVGGSPVGTEGADLLLIPLEDVYHIEIITERGRALVEQYGDLLEESERLSDRQRALLESEWSGRLDKKMDVENLPEILDFDNPIWETIAQQCIDCSICTFLCPTCHCFDIQDEGGPSAGERVRIWDSCASRLFTRMAVHQPRPTHASRYRQRIMHKFQYYPQNFDEFLCVGCGRCIQYCPMGVDITTVVQTLRE